MAFLAQDAFLETDRYYGAMIYFMSDVSPSASVLRDVLNENNVWWWDLGGGSTTFKGTPLNWRMGYLKNTSQYIRPKKIAEGIGALVVLIEDTKVDSSAERAFRLMEGVSSALGMDASEGATMGASERLLPGAWYSASVDWGHGVKAMTAAGIKKKLDTISVAIMNLDCGSFNPFEDNGNPFTDGDIGYFREYPNVAAFGIGYNGDVVPPTAKQIRDVLGAQAVYILREPVTSGVEATLLVAMCSALQAVTQVAFIGSRMGYAAVSTVVGVVDTIHGVLPGPDGNKWLRPVIYTALGLSAIIVGLRVFSEVAPRSPDRGRRR